MRHAKPMAYYRGVLHQIPILLYSSVFRLRLFRIILNFTYEHSVFLICITFRYGCIYVCINLKIDFDGVCVILKHVGKLLERFNRFPYASFTSNRGRSVSLSRWADMKKIPCDASYRNRTFLDVDYFLIYIMYV